MADRMDKFKDFRFWCQKVLPTIYDDSLSYYEALCKMAKHLNQVGEYVEELGKEITNSEGVQNYVTVEDLNKSEAEVGDSVIYNGEVYTISAVDNGFGIETVNGYAVRNFTQRRMFNYQMEKFFRYYLLGVATNSILQGSCYSDEAKTTAYIIRNSSDATLNKIVLITDGGSIIERYVPNVNGNDITYVDSMHCYIAVENYGNEGVYNFAVIDSGGNILQHLMPSNSEWKAYNIAYDKKHDRLVSYCTDFIAVYKPNIVDGKLELIKMIPFAEIDTVIPNDYAYTASQGCCCDDEGNFFVVSSVFFGDGYRKPFARVTQIDVVTGRVVDYADYEYNNAGTEAESLFFRDKKLYVNGYTVNGLCQMVIGASGECFKPDTVSSSIVYFDAENGSIVNDGMSASTPVNDLYLACSIAGSFEKGIVYMMTDEGSDGAGIIYPMFKKALIITSDTTTKRDVHSRFSITNENGYFELEYLNLFQSGTNNIVLCVNGDTRIRVYQCELTGDGVGSTYNELIKSDNGGSVSLDNVVVHGAFCAVTVTNGSWLGVGNITGTDGSDRICNANYGSIACIDTAVNFAQGFNTIGYQYGGYIIEGQNGEHGFAS